MALSIIIPAYNEEQTIGGVLAVLRDVKASEIIVVDDGSTDGTVQVVYRHQAADPRIRLLRMAENRGKTGAVLAGITASHHNLIVLLDADLVRLRAEHLQALIAPVQERRSAMSMAVFVAGPEGRDLAHWPTAMLSGQRCLRWSVFCTTPGLSTARWGLEVALNLHAWRNGHAIVRVPWPGVGHRDRLLKRRWAGIGSIARMWGEILRYWGEELIVEPLRKRLPRSAKPAPLTRESVARLLTSRQG
jgi:glycosyltransferase involved in cell wall biosynthesis